MMPRLLSKSDLEHTYDALAEAIDAAPEGKREIFLAKLAFALANLVGDTGRIDEAIAAAGRNL